MANIIYEDKDILVCHKQAGIAVQTRRIGQADMESELKNYRISKGEKPYIGIIHRLDQPVEGLLVFAKNPTSAANLSKQVATRQIAKYYYALAHMPENNQMMGSAWITLTDYLVRDGKTNMSRVVPETASGAKRAVLEYRIVRCHDGIALLDIHLHTGRHHQIRVQMAHAGMPLVGDLKYRRDNMDAAVWKSALENEKEDGRNNGAKIYGAEIENKHGLALCAYRLEFTHPASREKMFFGIAPQWIEI